MSLDKIRLAFASMNKCEAWSIQLLRIKSSKNKGTEYAAMFVNLTSQGKLTEFVKEISGHYIDVEKSELKTFLRVQNIFYRIYYRCSHLILHYGIRSFYF